MDLLSEIKEVLTGVQGIHYAFLFGSALKRLLPDSDIDILIGGDLDFDAKTRLGMDLAVRLKRDVDVVLTKEAHCDVVLNAFSRGEPVLIRNRELLKEDYFKNYRLCDASTSLRKIRLDKIKEKYGND